MAQLGKLTMLPVNKTFVFYSPIEGEDVLVRTGTIGEGSCFAAGTRVYTGQGVKNIEDIKIGDTVVTHNGNVKEVVQLHKNSLGDRRMHSLKVYKTPKVHVTDNHRLYVIKREGRCNYSKPQWVDVSHLNTSHYVMIPNRNDSSTISVKIDLLDLVKDHTASGNTTYSYSTIKDTITRTAFYPATIGNRWDSNSDRSLCKTTKPCNRFWNISPTFCQFLGIWYGDGCVQMKKTNQCKGISIVSCKENTELLSFVIEEGEKIFGIAPYIHESTKQNLVTVGFNNTVIGQVFVSLGFDGKRLPTFMNTVSNECVHSFLAGLISTDGCVDSNLNVSISLSNPTLIEEIYHLSRTRGIDASVSYRVSSSGKEVGHIRFSRHGLKATNKILKYYKDDRLNRLRNYSPKHNCNTGHTVRLYGNTFLRVVSNEVLCTDEPEYVYTLGIEDDHSYSVEGITVENCFFHSLLHAYSKDYVAMDKKGRMKFVHRLRASMAGKVNKENWQDIGGGLIAKIPFQENVNDILLNFYRFMTDDKRAKGKSTRQVITDLIGDDDRKIEVYKVLTELIPFEEGFEQNILPNAYGDCEDEKIDSCKEKIVKQTLSYLNTLDTFKNVSKPQTVYIIQSVKDFINTVVTEAENTAYNEYITGLQNISEDVDSYTIGLISDRFNRDIYFIDSTTRMPYRTADTHNLKSRKSMIVMWTGGVHYEIVGRLLPGNRVQREFSPDDPLIRKLYTFVCLPESVPEKYPDLTPYLPKEYRGNASPSPTRSYSSSNENSEIYESSDEDEDEDEDDDEDAVENENE